MNYTISEISNKMNLTPYTLRYYDKEGLLPFVEKGPNGRRIFKESDLDWLVVIECLKSSGMPIKDIKIFIDWCMEGDSTLQQRYDMFVDQKRIIEEHIAELQKTMSIVDYKCWYYKTALDAGTEKIHKDIKSGNIYKHK